MNTFAPISDETETNQSIANDRARATTRSTWVSVAVNVGLSFSQIIIGILAKSQGLVADGIHSLSDLIADFVVLFASQQSKKDADHDHPYGHQRYENAASLALGMLLIVVGGGMLFAAVGKLENPSTIAQVQTSALWVAFAALIAKESLFRYMLAVAIRVKSSLLVANAWHARSDAASSLVVAIGIGCNLAGYPIFDPIAALLVGIMVIRMGAQFSWTALNDLVDRAADEEEVEAIRQTLIESPGIRGVHDIRTRKMGDQIVVDVHLEVDAQLTVQAGHDIAFEAHNRVLKRHRVLNMMTHIDPYLENATIA